MPRFFFHVYSDEVVLDPEGVDLVSVEAARAKAEQGARDLACAQVRDGHLGLSHRIEVADENGGEVLSVRFRDVVRLHP